MTKTGKQEQRLTVYPKRITSQATFRIKR